MQDRRATRLLLPGRACRPQLSALVAGSPVPGSPWQCPMEVSTCCLCPGLTLSRTARPAHCAESDQCHLRYPVSAEFFCKPVRAVVADTTDATFPWSSHPQTHDPSGERRGHESLRWVGEDVLEQPEWAGVVVANQPQTRQAVSWEVPSRTEPQLPRQTPSRMPFPGAMSAPRPPLQAPLGIASQTNFCHRHPHFRSCI